MSRSSIVSLANVGRAVIGLLAVGYALGALAVARGPGVSWTYAGHSDVSATLAVAAGLALVAAGLLLSFRTLFATESRIAVLAGFAWFAPFWVGWEGGPSLVRSLGMIAAGLGFAFLVHLVLAFPYGQLASAATRALVVAVYAEAALSALVRALFRDPYLDSGCWDNCTANSFLVRGNPRLAHGIQLVDLWFTAGAALALAAFCVLRLGAATGPARRVLWPVLLAGIALGVATAAHSVAVESRPPESPRDAAFRAVYAVTCTAVIALALGLAWPVVRAYRQRLALARIVGEIAATPEPGTVAAALGAALGDASLRIAYWLPVSRRYGDAWGRPLEEPAAEPGRTLTPLARAGRPIAVVSHSGTSAELEEEIGATVRFALDNERLTAEVLAQIDDLRASRTRIVETADAERRRLERDLHDGAQQRLLALSYDIRLARADAERDGDARTTAALTGAVASTQAALGELRDIAHGIHPAILTQAGLGPALATLAESAPLPVELRDVTDGRYQASVEIAAYRTVVEALFDAAQRGATYVAVSASEGGHRLTVEVNDDGAARTSGMIRLLDRVGALGGRLDLSPTLVRAEIPCG